MRMRKATLMNMNIIMSVTGCESVMSLRNYTNSQRSQRTNQSRKMDANMDLDDPVRTLAESINPNNPRLVQAARILDYCGKKGSDLKTKLEACNTGICKLTIHFTQHYLITRLIFPRRRNFRATVSRTWIYSRKNLEFIMNIIQAMY